MPSLRIDDGLFSARTVAHGGRKRSRCLAGCLFAMAAWLATGASQACVSPPQTPIRDQLQEATSIAIFQLVSSEYVVERLGPDIETRLLRGRLKVVETLKGQPARFTRYELDAACNDLRMDVSDYFLVATTQRGSVLELGMKDATVMFVASAGSRGTSGLPYGSTDVMAVMEFLKGEPLPPSFGVHALPMTRKYHLPPPCER